MYRFVVSRRYVNLVFSIGSQRKKNISQLSKDSGMTTSHLTIVMRQWEKEGLILKIKDGREFDIELTDRGKQWMGYLKKYDTLARSEVEAEVEGEN